MKAAIREADELAGGVDCYVLSQTTRGRARRLWIAKRDHLIRQIESTMSASTLKDVLETEAKRNGKPWGSVPPGDSRSVETHTNIVVNAVLVPKDFKP